MHVENPSSDPDDPHGHGQDLNIHLISASQYTFGFAEDSIFFKSVSFIDEIIKVNLWYVWYSVLQIFVPAIQLFGVIYWPMLSNRWGDSKWAGFVKGLFQVITISTAENGNMYDNKAFFILLCFYVLWILAIAVAFIMFNVTGTLPKAMVILVHVIVHIGCPTTVIPAFHILGSSLRGLSSSQSAILPFVVMVAISVLSLFTFFGVQRVLGYLALPRRSFLVTIDSNFLYYLILFVCLQQVVTSLEVFFGDWFGGVVIAIFFIGGVFLLNLLRRYPAIGLIGNVCYGGWIVMFLTSSLIQILDMYAFKITYDVLKVLLPILGFIGGVSAFMMYFRNKRTKVKQSLDELEGSNDVSECIGSLGIQSQEEAKMWISMGYDVSSIPVLGGSFTIKLCEKFDTFEMWYITTAILSYNPVYNDEFFYALSRLVVRCTKSTINKIMVCHFQRIAERRMFRLSHEYGKRVDKLQEMSREVILYVKGFWHRVAQRDKNMDYGMLDTLVVSVNNAKAQWKEILSIYQDEQPFMEGWARFKAECHADFEGSMNVMLKAARVDTTTHMDPLFKQFCIAKPDAMYEIFKEERRLLKAKKGHEEELLDNDVYLDAGRDALGKGKEGGVIDRMVEKNFQWPRLRLALHKATSKYRPKGYKGFRTAGLLMYGLWTIMCIVAIILLRDGFSKFESTYNLIENITEIRLSLSYARQSLIMRWARSIGLMFTYDKYKSVIPESICQNEMAIDPKTLDGGSSWNAKLLVTLSELYGIISETASAKGTKLIQVIETGVTNYSVCIKTTDDEILLVPSRIYLRSAPAHAVWLEQICSNDVISKLAESPKFCQYNVIVETLPWTLDELELEYESYFTETEDEFNVAMTAYVTIAMMLSIIIFIPLMVVSQILLINGIHRVFDAMKSVDPTNAIQGTQPLMISERGKVYVQSNTFTHISSTFKTKFTFWQCCYALIFIISVVCLAAAYLNLNSYSDSVKETTAIIPNGQKRHALCVEILNMVTLEVLGRISGIKWLVSENVRDNFVVRMEEVTTRTTRYFESTTGMGSRDESIRKLHLNPRCKGTTTDPLHPHTGYECLGLESAISKYLILCQNFINNPAADCTSEEFINVYHLMCAELNSMLTESRRLDGMFIRSEISRANQLTTIFICMSLVCIIINCCISITTDIKLRDLLRMAMILIRHLPPPAIAESPELIKVLTTQNKRAEKNSSSIEEITFNNASTPIITVGESLMIERVNNAFKEKHKISQDMLIGHQLTSVIPRPDSGAVDMSVEEQGAYHLYDKLELMTTEDCGIDHCSYTVKCVIGDTLAPVVATAYAVRSKSGTTTSFIIMIEDQRELDEAEAKVQQLKELSETMLNQIIPRDIANFAAGREPFNFVVKSATLMAISITAIEDVIASGIGALEPYLAMIETCIKKNPPFVIIKTVYSTVYTIGGLFHDGTNSDSVAKPAVSLARDVTNGLSQMLPPSNKKRFTVGIAVGGPFLSGVSLRVNAFEVNGPLYDVVADYVVYAPKDSIVVSQKFRDTFEGSGEVLFRQGPVIGGEKTYLLQ